MPFTSSGVSKVDLDAFRDELKRDISALTERVDDFEASFKRHAADTEQVLGQILAKLGG